MKKHILFVSFVLICCYTSVMAQCHVDVRGRLNPLCDSTKLDWAVWTSVNGTSGSGTISSNSSILVTKPTGGLSTTGGMYNPTLFPSQYNVPVNNTAIRNDLAGLFTFCFNTPISNPQIALSSIGSPGNSVQVNTSAPYHVIWSGVGMSYPNNTTFVGTEGFTIIQFPGIHTCISFDYLQSESYCNLAFGALDTNCQAVASPPICVGGSDTLTASGSLTYSWTPTTGLNTSVGAVVIASPSVTTKYYVTGVDGSNCSSTDSIIVTVNPIPIAKITGDTIICTGDSTTLTASGGKTYLWLPGNFTDSVITVKPLTPTTYTVTATNAGGCKASSSINITVNPLPHALFNVPSVCKNEALIYNDISTGAISNWNWDFGDASTANVQSPTHTYATCGTFNSKLVVADNNGCKDSVTNPVTVNCLPVADFSFTNVCLHQQMDFHDLSTVSGGSIANRLWNFGDGSPTGNSTNPNHMYTNFGTDTVSLIVTTNNGCKDTITHNVLVYPLPVVNFSTVDVCEGTSTQFTDLSAVPTPDALQSWIWAFGNGTPFYHNQMASHSYAAGSYNVKLIVTSGLGCTDSITKISIVHPKPISNFTSTSVCNANSTTFTDASTTASGSISTWLWNFGDGASFSNLQNPSHLYSNAGNYTATIIVNNNFNCADTITKPVQVYYNPVADFSHVDICLGDTMHFVNTSTVNSSASITTYLWSFGTGMPSVTLQNPGYLYTAPGTEDVSFIVTTNNGCKDTVTKNVIVHPLPDAKFSASNVCYGNSTPFSDYSTVVSPDLIHSRHWNFGDASLADTSTNTSHSYTSAGSYTVKLVSVSSFGCSDSLTKTIVVNPNPVVNFTASDTIGCEPLCLFFQNASTIFSGNSTHYVWNLGDGNVISNSQIFDHCYTNDFIYSPKFFNVTLTVTSDSGCVTTKTKNNYITVYPKPNADFTVQPQTTAITNPMISITDVSTGANFWNWNFGDHDTTAIHSPSFHQYTDTGTYQIMLITSTQYKCVDTAYQTVIIEPGFIFYIPNAFSPNDDGVNDTFTGTGDFIKNFQMTIFDRWGNLIFYSNDVNKPWDGKANYGNQMAKQDVYIYAFDVTDIKNKKHNYKGIVTLIK